MKWLVLVVSLVVLLTVNVVSGFDGKCPICVSEKLTSTVMPGNCLIESVTSYNEAGVVQESKSMVCDFSCTNSHSFKASFPR